MRGYWLAVASLCSFAFSPCLLGEAPPSTTAVIVTDFSNPELSPSHWTLTLHRDGSGHFHSERGDSRAEEPNEMDAPNVDRDLQVSPEFAESLFQAAKRHHWFNEQCESRLKVAFQGWKELSYSGPEGHGSCRFNYAKDKEIQSLGDSLTGVAETMLEGARLEMLMQHDRLGLDKEMEFLTDATRDGRMRELGAIREILERLEADPEVLDRVRKRAHILLEHPGT